MTFTTRIVAGGQLPGQVLQITNQGSGSLTWSAIKTASWLSLSFTSGTAPSSPVVLVSPVGLGVGSYTDTITISAPGSLPVTVAVTLNITLL
jgi:hypothetical protein